MKAMTARRYGGPETVTPETLPRPIPGAGDVLVRVAATSVTTADWRLRAAAFPGGFALLGRLMFGLTGPRTPVRGMEFAGIVESVGADVTAFQPGQPVFGITTGGAHAEYLVIAAEGSIAPLPEGLDFHEAAALPFGAICALVFFRDVAKLRKGEHVAIVGASGGVGTYAVQIAKAMGAEVTAVAGPDSQEYLSVLGADHRVDYTMHDVTTGAPRFDVIFDTVGALSFRDAARVLRGNGRFVPLNFSLWALIGSALGKLLPQRRKGPRRLLSVNGDSKADLLALSAMVQQGQLVPRIDRVWPLHRLADAYAYVEGRHRRGSVVISVADLGDAATSAA